MHYQLMTLNAEYAAALDEDQLEQWPNFFTAHCRYRVTTRSNFRRGMPAGLIYADSRDMLADRVLSLRKANVYEAQQYRHVIGLPRIMAAANGVPSRAITSFVVLRISRQGHTDIFASGDYHDELATEEGELRFAVRDVVCDSSRIDTLLAIPL